MGNEHVPILPNLLWCTVMAKVDHPVTIKAVKLISDHLSAGGHLPFASGVLLNQVSNELDLLSIQGITDVPDLSEDMKVYAAK